MKLLCICDRQAANLEAAEVSPLRHRITWRIHIHLEGHREHQGPLPLCLEGVHYWEPIPLLWPHLCRLIELRRSLKQVSITTQLVCFLLVWGMISDTVDTKVVFLLQQMPCVFTNMLLCLLFKEHKDVCW